MSHPLVSFFRFLPAVRARTAAALLAVSCGLSAGAVQAQDVYLNGTVGASIAPGVYGQINFGSRPPPPVLYAQPILIQRSPTMEPPLYLYVPPGHSKNWRRYCKRYDACGRPVYFVQVNDKNRWWAAPHGGPRSDYDRRDESGDRGKGPRHDRGHDDNGRDNDRYDQGRDDGGPGRGGQGHRKHDN